MILLIFDLFRLGFVYSNDNKRLTYYVYSMIVESLHVHFLCYKYCVCVSMHYSILGYYRVVFLSSTCEHILGQELEVPSVEEEETFSDISLVEELEEEVDNPIFEPYISF